MGMLYTVYNLMVVYSSVWLCIQSYTIYIYMCTVYSIYVMAAEPSDVSHGFTLEKTGYNIVLLKEGNLPNPSDTEAL